MSAPEKLSLWDRLFNRYRKEIHQRGSEPWTFRVRNEYGQIVTGSESRCTRQFVEYKIVDRLTGSERIERDYLT